jgi:archaellum biogenesis ATPase FlaH
MYRKEVNERSPMRVFEKSTHGGLGRGNVGLVAARPGVGKTALLVQIALDDLLRDRKVLHISHEHAVDHVRSYYDEIFHDLSVASHLEQEAAVRVDVERNRLLFSHLGHVKEGPLSARGGHTPVTKILETVAFARDIAHFEPDVIVIDGFDFDHATPESVKALRELAEKTKAELWFSAQTEGREVEVKLPGGKTAKVAAPLDRYFDLVNVMVMLEPQRDVVRLRLLKDHENPDVSDLHLRLDSHTMRVIDEDLPAQSERPKDARRFKLVAGGNKGAEAEFGRCAEKWGLHETHYTFKGHKLLDRERGVLELDEDELKKGDFSLKYVSKRLNRILSDIPQVRSILQTIWHQINAANQVFVVGAIQDDGTVKGGTGWGAELARLWRKPLYVFDQNKKAWFRWTGTAWEMSSMPTITAETFAGVGTQSLNDDGKQAIFDLFLRSFGQPS